MRRIDLSPTRWWLFLAILALSLGLGAAGVVSPAVAADEAPAAAPPAAEATDAGRGTASAAETAKEPAQEETTEENVLVPQGTFEKGSDVLVVESRPAGARVFVDGEEKGVTPLSVRDLADGPHEVVLYLSGRGAYRQAVSGRGGRIVVDLESNKGLGVGLVTVTSTPPDARVDVDGQKAGLSPLEVPLESGRHTLHISKTGFKPVDLTVDVGSDERKEVPVALVAKEGALLVLSNPVGADVTLDGKPAGKTWEPLVVKDVAPGLHAVRVSKDGYRPWEKADVEVRSDHSTSVLAALLPVRDYTWVRLYTKPAGARVWLDGQEVGVAGADGLAVKTSKGAHSLRFEVDPAVSPGFQSLQAAMTFSDDDLDFRENPIALPPIDENYTNGLSLIERGQKEEALGFLGRVAPEHPSYAPARLAVVGVLRDLGRVRDIPTELGTLVARPEYQNNPALNLALGYWSLVAGRDLPDTDAVAMLSQGMEALDRAVQSMDLVPADQRDVLTLKANYYAGMTAEILFDLTGEKKHVKKGSQAWEVFFAHAENNPKAFEETWIEKARRHRQSLAFLAKKLGG
ncbi:MAG: PEGA domain-containing protein [Deltaproteobacteria bacterium]|nr:PEGA domain-containing protein [Deltaproteobacteria bacterium]